MPVGCEEVTVIPARLQPQTSSQIHTRTEVTILARRAQNYRTSGDELFGTEHISHRTSVHIRLARVYDMQWTQRKYDWLTSKIRMRRHGRG